MRTTTDLAGRARLARRVGARRPSHGRHPVAAVLFLSPALAVIGVFMIIPIGLTLWISLHRWSMFTPFAEMQFVGLENYARAISPAHLQALQNTAVYVGLSVLITVPLAILVSFLLYFPRLHGRGLVRVLLFSTYVVPTVAIVIIWSALYAPNYGPLDTVLAAVGIESPGWLSRPSAALVSLVIFNVWQMLGYYVVLLVAGLTQIPEEVFEAARLDGAGVVRQSISVTIPLLRGSLVFVTLMTFINSIQVFDPVYMLTQGGPANSTNVLSFDIQRTAFQNGLAGEASALAFSLFVLVAAVGAIVGLAARRRQS